MVALFLCLLAAVVAQDQPPTRAPSALRLPSSAPTVSPAPSALPTIGIISPTISISPTFSPTVTCDGQGEYYFGVNKTCRSCSAGRVPSMGTCFYGTAFEYKADDRQLGGSCYAGVAEGMKWTAAERYCHDELGGHLVCVNDETEASFLVDLFKAKLTSFWIGLNSRGNAFSYSWSDKTCCSHYRRWEVEHVKNSDGSKTTTREPTSDVRGTTTTRSRCVRMSTLLGRNKLLDEPCGSHYAFVCEAPVSHMATSCAECGLGRYAHVGARKCESCSFGKYAASFGSSHCEQCPTWSPAAVLVSIFSRPDSQPGASSGSIRCGGSIGKSQRATYFSISVCGIFGAALLSWAAYVAQASGGRWLRTRNLALLWTADARKSKRCATVAAAGTFCGLLVSSILVAVWLEPLRQQEAVDRPYRGRLAAYDIHKGCDPGKTQHVFFCAIAFFGGALGCLLLALPVVDVAGVAHRCRRFVVRKRLQRAFGRERAAWRREELLRQQRLEGSLAVDATLATFSCTLCGVERAYALNEPCSHQFLCAACAATFRAENGDVCNACRQPSRLVILKMGENMSLLLNGSNAAAFHEFHDDTAPPPSTRKADRPFLKGVSINRTLVGDDIDPRTATETELKALIMRTQATRTGARLRFAARACHECGELRGLLVSMPCGHANVCADCATRKGIIAPGDDDATTSIILSAGESGAETPCLRCGQPSRLRRPVRDLCCSICFDSVSASNLVALGACGHQLCTACSVGYVRSALGDVGEHIRAAGIRCPLHVTGCQGTVTLDVVQRLVSRPVRADRRDDVLPLAAVEFDRLARFFDEAAIPLNERFYCTHADCARLFAVPGRDALIRWASGTGGALAPPPTTDGTVRYQLKARVTRLRQRLQRPLVEAEARTGDRYREALEQNNNQNNNIQNNNNTSNNSNTPRGGTTTTTTGTVVVDYSTSTSGDVEMMMTRSGLTTQQVAIDVESASTEEADRQRFRDTLPFVHCPFCERSSCVRCNVPAHRLVSCRAAQSGDAATALTTAFVNATSKPCPQCSFRITHSHGHACHHIKPGTGCPNCGTHFCYKCLRRGTSGRACGCRLFCDNDNVLGHIADGPYPNDTRCGCTFCSSCKLGLPCEQCNGGCVVCLGVVRPGPSSVEEVHDWKPHPPASS